MVSDQWSVISGQLSVSARQLRLKLRRPVAVASAEEGGSWQWSVVTALSRNKIGLLRFAFAIRMPLPLIELPSTAVETVQNSVFAQRRKDLIFSKLRMLKIRLTQNAE